MRVVFMGTPDIAATCLNKILESGFDIDADAPGGTDFYDNDDASDDEAYDSYDNDSYDGE